MSRARSRAKRRGLLQGQEHQSRDQLQPGRRLRSLRPHARRATWASTSPAIRRSCRRTCRAPAGFGSRNYLYTAAPKDGLTFGTFTAHGRHRAAVDPTQKYDGAKFTWLGAITDAVSVCITWHTSPVKTWNDFSRSRSRSAARAERRARHLHQPLQERVQRQGEARAAAIPARPDHAGDGARRDRRRLRHRLDHASSASATLDRGEEDQHHRPGRLPKDPDLPDVPLIMDLTRIARSSRSSSCSCPRTNSRGPLRRRRDPADRAAALIAAFDATMKDPEFLAEAGKHQMEVAPVSGKSSPRCWPSFTPPRRIFW